MSDVQQSDYTHAIVALELAVLRLPGVWDDEQRAAIGRVIAALREQSDRPGGVLFVCPSCGTELHLDVGGYYTIEVRHGDELIHGCTVAQSGTPDDQQ